MTASRDDVAERRRKLGAILAQIDKLPRNEGPPDLEWDENGLPI